MTYFFLVSFLTAAQFVVAYILGRIDGAQAERQRFMETHPTALPISNNNTKELTR